jgi:hypothetical protein
MIAPPDSPRTGLELAQIDGRIARLNAELIGRLEPPH